MRKLFTLAVIIMMCLGTMKTMADNHGLIDSARITHVIDGNIGEWKIDRFETDKETQILYAVDHDANNLYVAMKIGDQRMQMKMMMQGMSMFIDKRGKRKEGTGIEFPIKKTREGGVPGGSRRGGAPAAQTDEMPDMKEVHDRMLATMIILKTFGFENQDEEKTQMIDQPASVNLAFNWNETNDMFIEYMIPISLLGKSADLNGKPLGIGWKINGISIPTEAGNSGAVNSFARPTGAAASSRGGGRQSAGTNSNADAGVAAAADGRFKDQSVWTKYVLTF